MWSTCPVGHDAPSADEALTVGATPLHPRLQCAQDASLGGLMERERPHYLPPIERRRWEFPWMTVIAIALAAVMLGGLHTLSKTHTAWSARFEAKPASQPPPPPAGMMPADSPPLRSTSGLPPDALVQLQDPDYQEAYRLQRERDAALIDRIRERDRMARIQQAAKRATRPAEVRCVQGTLYMLVRESGRWEKLHGSTCDSSVRVGEVKCFAGRAYRQMEQGWRYTSRYRCPPPKK